MMATLRARVWVEFPISHELLTQLIRLAQRHYDRRCQQAAMRINSIAPGRPSENGILVIWQDRFGPIVRNETVTEIYASFDEIDLVAKICEPYHSAISAECAEFHDQLVRMMQQANRVRTDWVKTVEV